MVPGGAPPVGPPWPQEKQPVVQESWKKSITVFSWFWMLWETPAALYASNQPFGPYEYLVQPLTGVFCVVEKGV